jgi:hypothetical protein
LIPSSVEVPFPAAYSAQKQNLILLGAALLLAVIVVGFAVWHFTNPLKQSPIAKLETPVLLPAEMQIFPAPPVPKQDMIAPAIPAEPKLRSSVTVEQVPVHPAKSAAAQIVPHIPQVDSATHYDASSAQTTTLRLVFDAESWTEIRGKDGNTLSARVHAPGSEMRLHGQAPLALVIGHAASVHLFKNGEPVDLTPYINSSSEVARLTLE